MSNALVTHFSHPNHRLFGGAWCGANGTKWNGPESASDPAHVTCKKCLAKLVDYTASQERVIHSAVRTAYATKCEQNFKAFGINCRVRFDTEGVLRYAAAKVEGREVALASLKSIVEASR